MPGGSTVQLEQFAVAGTVCLIVYVLSSFFIAAVAFRSFV